MIYVAGIFLKVYGRYKCQPLIAAYKRIILQVICSVFFCISIQLSRMGIRLNTIARLCFMSANVFEQIALSAFARGYFPITH